MRVDRPDRVRNSAATERLGANTVLVGGVMTGDTQGAVAYRCPTKPPEEPPTSPKFQLLPEHRSPTLAVFSSPFRQPQLGFYNVFLYYQKP